MWSLLLHSMLEHPICAFARKLPRPHKQDSQLTRLDGQRGIRRLLRDARSALRPQTVARKEADHEENGAEGNERKQL
jgi:hypothetical protein